MSACLQERQFENISIVAFKDAKHVQFIVKYFLMIGGHYGN